MSGEQQTIKLVITDLDDTLWRWPLLYVEPYRRMLIALSQDFDIPLNQLAEEVQAVHRLHQDTEYPLSILEIDSIKTRYPHMTLEERHQVLKPYIDLFETTHQQHLSPSLFHPVHETLAALRQQGIKIISYTDANAYAITQRLYEYQLIDFFDKIYCRGTHDLKESIYQPWHEALAAVGEDRLVLVDKSRAKPQPEILRQILADINETRAANDKIQPSEVLYVGDSLERDMRMVQNFNRTYCMDGEMGITAVHAQYGRQNDIVCDTYIDGISRAELMKFMVSISYWSEEQNRKEMHAEANHHTIERHYTLENHFGQLLELDLFTQPKVAQAEDEICEAALLVGNYPSLVYSQEQVQEAGELAVANGVRLAFRP